MQVVAQDSTRMNVIQSDEIKIATITSREYVSGMNGVVVTTRVPSNLFSFIAGEAISISGVIQMKLADGGIFDRRNLLAAANGGEDDESSVEQASFEVKIDLNTPEMTSNKRASFNSASFVKGMGLSTLVMVLFLSYSMW